MSAILAGKEMTKTLLFVGAAVVALVLAVATKPAKFTERPDDQVGKPLFDNFTDASDASGLEVLSFDKDLAKLKSFRVAKQEQGIWALPSHQNYPADAQDRLVNAATMFIDLKVISVVSDADGDHETFGVVEPNPNKTQIGDEGIGTLVKVFGETKDGSQTNLADLILGKPVKGLDGQHYVRRSGKSRVYQVEIDPSQLSTKFEDWIETDLLDLNTWDIANLTLKDYSVETQPTPQGLTITNYDQRLEVKVSEDAGKWNLDLLKEFIEGDLRPSDLEEGEQLNKERLDTLKNALGDLKIVDVERKPAGLGADLKADKGFLNDQEGMISLARRGFYPVPQDDGSTELWSSNGELLISTKDGVRYVLRFGQIAGMGETSTNTEDGGAGERGVNRYLFVSALVNESQFPEPDLEMLPEGAENVDLAASDSSEGEGSETTNDEGDKDHADDELARKVERITKANQRKIDERNDKIEEAMKKVSERSYRFADWYYIVSDDVFKKLRLRRGDVITFSEEALKSGTGLSAFRHLQAQGLVPDSNTEEPATEFPPLGFPPQ